MKQLVNSLVIFLAVGSLCSGCKAKRAQPDNLFSTRADSLMATFPDFSGVLLLAKGGRPIYHRAFGYQNFETKRKVDTASVFELASVSKQFTAMIIMQLKDEGKLNFDDGKVANIVLTKTIPVLINITNNLQRYKQKKTGRCRPVFLFCSLTWTPR